MRSYLLLLVTMALLLTSCSAIGELTQNDVPKEIVAQMPKKVNAFLISSEKKPKEALSRLSVYLSRNGFPAMEGLTGDEDVGFSFTTNGNHISYEFSPSRPYVYFTADTYSSTERETIITVRAWTAVNGDWHPVQRGESFNNFAASLNVFPVAAVLGPFCKFENREPYEGLEFVWMEAGEPIADS